MSETTTKAPLQIKLQTRMGITDQLTAAGGSMTRRKLYNMRRGRSRSNETRYRWNVAMLQLIENRYVEQTGTGRRGDPIVVRLVKPLRELSPVTLGAAQGDERLNAGLTVLSGEPAGTLSSNSALGPHDGSENTSGARSEE